MEMEDLITIPMGKIIEIKDLQITEDIMVHLMTQVVMKTTMMMMMIQITQEVEVQHLEVLVIIKEEMRQTIEEENKEQEN